MKKKTKKRVVKVTKERIADPEQIWRSKTYFGYSDKQETYFQDTSTLTVSDIKDLLATDFWIKSCVNTIVDEVIKYPLTAAIEKGVKSNSYLLKQVKRINSFLKYPNEKEPLFLLRKKYLKDMLFYGNGVCVIDYKGKNPYKLRAIPGYTLGVTEKEPPTYVFQKVKSSDYLTDKNGKKIELTLNQVMHFQIEAMSDDLLAETPLNPLYYHLWTDTELIKRVMRIAKKGGRLPATLSVEKSTQKTFISMLKWMNKSLDAGASLVGLNKKMDVNPLPHWSATETIAMFKWMGMAIATVYKVPPFMLNLVENTGSLNAREQYSRFLENVVEPILKYEQYLYTLCLVKRAFKVSSIEITAPMVATKLNYSRARVARTLSTKDTEIFSVDEIRKDIFGKE